MGVKVFGEIILFIRLSIRVFGEQKFAEKVFFVFVLYFFYLLLFATIVTTVTAVTTVITFTIVTTTVADAAGFAWIIKKS